MRDYRSRQRQVRLDGCRNRQLAQGDHQAAEVRRLPRPLQGDPGERGLGWLWFCMFHHLAQLPSQFCQIPILPKQKHPTYSSSQTRWDTLYVMFPPLFTDACLLNNILHCLVRNSHWSTTLKCRFARYFCGGGGVCETEEMNREVTRTARSWLDNFSADAAAVGEGGLRVDVVGQPLLGGRDGWSVARKMAVPETETKSRNPPAYFPFILEFTLIAIIVLAVAFLETAFI